MKKITKILLGSLGCIGASCFAPFVSSCEAPTFSFQVLTGIPVPQKFGNNNFGDTLKDLVDKQPEQYPVLTDFIKDCFFQVAQTVTETDSVSFNVSLGHNLYTAFLFGYCPESSQVNPSNVNVT
ncbi:MAG: hypothetical protein K2M43_00500 [Mycoplasmoidaceae bacterium]|nr:hypothetical protein [Mycoplasmoidaceae bacterium]